MDPADSAMPVPRKQRNRRMTAAEVEAEALRDRRRLFRKKQSQEQKDIYAAQRHSVLTDGSSRTISKRGVRQRGMSDAEAGTVIRQELADGAASGRPAPATGFSPSGMGKPLQLRTEAERMARIGGSPVMASAQPVMSNRSGDFSAAQSEQYRQQALAMGGTAKMPGSAPRFAGTSGNPTYTNVPPDPFKAQSSTVGGGVPVQSPQGQRLAAGFEPQGGTPKVTALLPKAQQTRMDGAGMAGPPKALSNAAPAIGPVKRPATPPRRMSPSLTGGAEPKPSASPEPSSKESPMYGDPRFETASQFATGMTPDLRRQMANNISETGILNREMAGIKTPWSPKWKEIEDQVNRNIADRQRISAAAKRNAPIQNEQARMSGKGIQGPPRSAAKLLR